MSQTTTPDLTQRAPRSARVKLGGFAILPRMLDKGRATIAGKNGEYHYNCPLDQRFTEFAGIDAEAMKKELAAGKGDGEILEWIHTNSKKKPSDVEVKIWSELASDRAPMDVESRQYFTELHGKVAPKREDVGTWFDLLDIDDFVTFGGKA
jgi:hypothetical protein